jgi:succinate-semialdehyde dehydrogenase / glutarate-semialdehyde dehydrogenase
MTFKSINPVNQEVLAVFEINITPQKDIEESKTAFETWKSLSVSERQHYMKLLAGVLEKNKAQFAKDISLEMGKTLMESTKEIEKCISTIVFYANSASHELQDKPVSSPFYKSYYTFEPLGGIFAIMPWNFPFWQVLRFSVPTLLAGNVVLLKHAPNVLISAQNILQAFDEAGIPKGVFSLLLIDIDQVESVISNNFIKGVTLTGSNIAGSSVSALSGKYLKKSVLELGGSDPFVVLEGANIDLAAQNAVTSRFQNAGQTCIAAKRWIVEESVFEEFYLKVVTLIGELSVGDPFDSTTSFGPMARLDLAEKIDSQIDILEKLGARVVIRGKRNGCFIGPSLLILERNVSLQFTEELFGPVACLIMAKDADEAVEIANETNFGLGATVWTEDLEFGESIMKRINAGSVFLNSMVKSHASMPFGGINQSGYGRELGVYGFHEFCNIKSYIIEE